MRGKPKGWRYESNRHALASRGIKTRFAGNPIPTNFKDNSTQKPTTFNDLRNEKVEMSTFGSGWPETFVITEETQMKLQLAMDHVHSKFESDALALYTIFNAVHGDVSSEYVALRTSPTRIYQWAKRSYEKGRLDQDIQAVAEEAHPDLKDLSKTIILHDLEALPEKVINLPKGWDWQAFVMDQDEWEQYRHKLPKTPSKTLRIVYWEGLPEDWVNIPKGYKTLVWFDHM